MKLQSVELRTALVEMFPYESTCIWFFNDLQHRGDCQSTRKSCKTGEVVGWTVGWNATPTASYVAPP